MEKHFKVIGRINPEDFEKYGILKVKKPQRSTCPVCGRTIRGNEPYCSITCEYMAEDDSLLSY